MVAEPLIGRASELREIQAFLDGPGGRVLVISGEAGIGKTTLIDATVASRTARPDRRVAVVRAVRAETGLAYVTLTDLLGPLLPEGAAGAAPPLPEPQCAALDAILLLAAPSPSTATDPRTVGMATHGTLQATAGVKPLVVVIDDAQWMDPASAEALAFAIRRLRDEPIWVVATVRTSSIGASGSADAPAAPDPFDTLRTEGRVDDLVLGPASLAVLHHLVAERVGTVLPRPRLMRLETASGGNPLLAIEIARELARRDTWPLPGEPLPVPADARRLFETRIGRLTPDERLALATVAAMATPSREPLVADHLGPSIDAGLLIADADDGRIRFAHPLVVDASLDAVSEADRRAIHARLADLATSAEDRGRHLALAATGPDEDVAAALDAAASEARRRGATSMAAEWAGQAAARTPPEEVAAWAVRTTRSARWLADAGEIERARERLIDVVERASPGNDRADAMLLLAQIDAWDRGGGATLEWGDRGLGEATDPDLRARLLLRIAFVFDATGLERALAATDEAVAILDAAPADRIDPDLLACALLQRAEIRLAGGIAIDREAIDRARSLLTGDPRPTADGDVTAESLRAYARLWESLVDVDELEVGHELQLAEMERARARGLERPMPIILGELAVVELWLGDWDAASRHADDALDASEVGGMSRQGRVAAMAARASIDAARGDLEAASDRAHAALAISDDPNEWTTTRLQAALALVALTRGDAAKAFATLAPVYDRIQSTVPEMTGFRFVGDLLEAAVTCGEVAFAERVHAGLVRSCATVPRPWVVAMEARGRTLLAAAVGDLEAATKAIEAALAAHDTLPMPFERGRSLVVAGRIARRRKERRRAADLLAEAATTFRALGAAGWAAITEAELARTGRRAPPEPDALTETEDRVARLAAQGLTNREVAEAAFLTPKSVEGVLARVYGKLGIRSRAELGGWLAAQSDRESPVSTGRASP